MNNFFSIKEVVPSSSVDAKQNLRFDRILDYMQNVTTAHSVDLKVDHDALIKSSNAFWVLTKIKFKIVKNAHFNESVCFNTWPTEVLAYRFFREYEFLGENGANIQGRTEWCMLDATTHALRKPSTTNYPSDMVHLTKKADVSGFTKFLNDNLKFNYINTHKVGFIDIDVNLHTNNVSYARMALNTFNIEEFLNYDFKSFELHFLRQTFYGEEIEIYKSITQNGVIVKGVKDNQNIFCCLFS